MCKHDDGCNAPEGECSGACMTQQTSSETLEEIAERIALEVSNEHGWSGANPDLPIKQWNVLFVQALITDPAILNHIPAVKALREENERLKTDLGIERRSHAKLESQLAELRQGGEAVYQIQCGGDFDDRWTDTNEKVWSEHYKSKRRILFTRPQPSIPPGYVVVPPEATREMFDRMMEFANANRWISSNDPDAEFKHFAEGYKVLLASAPAIQPQAAVPIDENGQLLGTEHKGMRVDYTGMLGQAIKGLRANPGVGFMLSELERNITEVGDRYYSGDIKAVDEFLQLYCVARDKRAMLSAAPSVPVAEKALPENVKLLLLKAHRQLETEYRQQTRATEAKRVANGTCGESPGGASSIALLAESGYISSIGKRNQEVRDEIFAMLAAPADSKEGEK